MSQPHWKYLCNLGDATPLDHGGYFVFTDETGVYDAEAELLVEPQEGKRKFEIRRVGLEPCTYVNGILSDNSYHPESAAWFAEGLGENAKCMGISEEALRDMLCSTDPRELANGYRYVGDYHGWDNLDQYPLYLTRKEVEARYKEAGVPV